MRAGDTVWTPPGEEHWHGGTDANSMCHIAPEPSQVTRVTIVTRPG